LCILCESVLTRLELESADYIFSQTESALLYCIYNTKSIFSRRTLQCYSLVKTTCPL
jgi:hypothetical protein